MIPILLIFLSLRIENKKQHKHGKKMNSTQHIINECLENSDSRFNLWVNFLNKTKSKNMVELGVYRGEFAAYILKKCSAIEKYYMLDPWRHLDNWNKPANKDNIIFEEFLNETKSKTDFAKNKRIILQGKTTEVSDNIADNELDFAYIDGDHTLKGITIDLIRLYPKIKDGGWIGGDDFSKTVWQHATTFEPTLVFPFAVYFAEAVDARIYALPNSQFLIEKSKEHSFSFIDLTGNYRNTELRDQLHPKKVLELKIKQKLPSPRKIIKRIKELTKIN